MMIGLIVYFIIGVLALLVCYRYGWIDEDESDPLFSLWLGVIVVWPIVVIVLIGEPCIMALHKQLRKLEKK